MRGSQALIAMVAWLAMACTGRDDGTPLVVRTDSAGVEVLTSTLDDRPLEWSFEREWVRGGADEGPEAFYRVTRSSVDADVRGRLYVLDRAQSQVVVFSPDGEFLHTFGARGEGPGELVSPGSMVVSGDGTVQVVDLGKGRLVGFGPDGVPTTETAFGAYAMPGSGRHIGAGATGIYVASTLPDAPEGRMWYGLQLYEADDTTLLADHLFPMPAMEMYDCGGGFSLPRVFETNVAWDNQGSLVAASPGPGYGVTLFDGVRTVRRIAVDRPPRPATESMAIAELGEGFRVDFGQGLCIVTPEEMVPLRGFTEVLPWVDDIAVSPSGEVWVRRFEVGPEVEGPIDLFDATGAYVGTAPPDTPFPLAFLDADRFAAAEVDATDVERVAVYRILRDGG